MGIALLTQFCADVCRESGESGAASTVELTGKMEILLLCLPLLDEILSAARELLSLGG
jgi:stage III sporulation protein AD